MADGIPCRKCGYSESMHDLRATLRKEKLTMEEFWKEHPKLAKCLFVGRSKGYKP